MCYYGYMERVRISKKSKDIKEIRKLYDTSFPNEERIPFVHLVSSLSKDRIIDAYYEEGKLMGMTVIFLSDDLEYLSYICIERSFQGRGYGTRILNQIKQEYPDNRIVVDIEETEYSRENLGEKIRRKEFYMRNGFVPARVFYTYAGVEYELMCCNGMIIKDDWQKIMRKHWGKYADYATYR